MSEAIDVLPVLLRELGGLEAEWFVETGTADGSLSALVRQHWRGPVLTVERDYENYLKASRRFIAAGALVVPLFGDSGALLDQVAPLVGRAVYYLDAHTNDECPLISELGHIVAAGRPCSVVIDDVRLFGQPGWPSMAEVLDAAPGFESSTEEDLLVLRRGK